MTKPAFSQTGLKVRSRYRWLILALASLGFIVPAITVMNSGEWVETWVGAMFRTASGAVLGWFVCRFVDVLDLSDVPAEQRTMAAISRAIIIGLFALAVATGV